MALANDIAQYLVGLASHMDLNTISPSDARERLELIMESLAAYSAFTDTDVDEVALDNLLSAHQQLDSVVPGCGRPTINIPFEVIEMYLLHGLTVNAIAKLFGVNRKTITRKMASHGLR